VSWCRGVVVSWCRGVVVSWCRGVVVSWCRGVVCRVSGTCVGPAPAADPCVAVPNCMVPPWFCPCCEGCSGVPWWCTGNVQARWGAEVCAALGPKGQFDAEGAVEAGVCACVWGGVGNESSCAFTTDCESVSGHCTHICAHRGHRAVWSLCPSPLIADASDLVCL
jgi:hypothetical protein